MAFLLQGAWQAGFLKEFLPPKLAEVGGLSNLADVKGPSNCVQLWTLPCRRTAIRRAVASGRGDGVGDVQAEKSDWEKIKELFEGPDDEDEDGSPVVDWEAGTDLGAALGEEFGRDLGFDVDKWPKPYKEENAYDWVARARQRAEAAVELRRRDLELMESQASKKKSNKKSRKDNSEDEDIFPRDVFRVGGRIVTSPEEAFAAWTADRPPSATLGISRPPLRFTDKLGQKYTPPSRKIDKNSEETLHKSLLAASDEETVLRLISEALDVAGIDSTGAVAENFAEKGAVTAVNIATGVHRMGRFVSKKGMLRRERVNLTRRPDVARLVRVALALLPFCNPQGISNIAWGLSKAGASGAWAPEVLDTVAAAALRRLRRCRAQHLANLASAFATLNHDVPALLEGICSQAASRGPTAFQPRELSQLLWSFATLNTKPSAFLDSIDHWVLQSRTPKTPPPRSLDQHSHNPEQNTQKTAQKSSKSDRKSKNNSENPEGLRRYSDFVTEAEARDRPSFAEFVGGEVGALRGVFGDFNANQLANMAWAYAVLGGIERPGFEEIWKEIERKGSDRFAQHDALLSQLHQTSLSLQFENSPPVGGWVLNPPLLAQKAEEAWEKEKSTDKKTSKYQVEVEAALDSLGRDYVPEFLESDYSIDIALVDERVAIEVDGPTHFTRNTGRPLGSTVLKRRHLAAAGWTVVSISYKEWEAIKSESEQRQYLRDRLAQKSSIPNPS